MFPGIIVCRHFQVDWLDAAHCRCKGCGKIGHWSNELVIWQRRSTGLNGAPITETATEGIGLGEDVSERPFAKLAS